MDSPWGCLSSELRGCQAVILVLGIGPSWWTASLISLTIQCQPVVRAKCEEAGGVLSLSSGFVNSVWTCLLYMHIWPWTTCWPWEASGLYQYNGSDNGPPYTSCENSLCASPWYTWLLCMEQTLTPWEPLLPLLFYRSIPGPLAVIKSKMGLVCPFQSVLLCLFKASSGRATLSGNIYVLP